ncbi:MAG: ABC transporter permease [Acidimicrobiales bacterium]
MLRFTLKSLLARKVRLALTAVAIVLGVSFMAGTMVLTDTIGSSFDRLFAQVNQGIDAVARSSESVEAGFGVEVRGRVAQQVVDQVASAPGVAAAEGQIQGFAQVVGADGEAVGNPGQGPPTFGLNWTEHDEVNPMRLLPGSRAPAADDEIALDKHTADLGKLNVGDQVTVLTKNEPRQFELVGVAKFGSADSAGGASLVFFTSRTAQALLAEPGAFDSVLAIAEDGVSQAELKASIQAEVDSGQVEVLTGAEFTKENQDQIAQGLSFFNVFLLVFALVALFVGSFIIYNTFSIIVAQRARQDALLRALGASRRQVAVSVLLEALATGLAASVVGIVVGLGMALLLKAVLGAFGIDLPAGGLTLRPRTIGWAMLAGVGVTVVASLVPSLRASRAAPVAAISGASGDRSSSSLVRIVVGGVVVALGLGLLASGLLGGGSQAAAQVGAGAAITFLGVAVLGPVIARPVSTVLGAVPARLRGMPGVLARENAKRNPKRTSATAAALMIGVGIVTFITVFAQSTKATINATVDDAFGGDFAVTSNNQGFGGLSPQLAAELRSRPELGAVSALRGGVAEVAGKGRFLTTIDPNTFDSVFDVEVVSGSLRDLGADGFAIDERTAKDKGWTIGTQVDARFPDSGAKTLTLRAIYDELPSLGGAGAYLIGLPAYEANFADAFDSQIFVRTADGVSDEAARAVLEEVAGPYANAQVQDRTDVKEAAAAQVNQLLGLIFVMLILAIVIALFGIANTLGLSIIERTRELGLLRAVGMTRPQVRSTVRWESVIIALLGALLGLGIGVFFGWAIITSLRDEGFDVLAVPVPLLVVIGVLAALAGVAAAVFPAMRASRLDVLDAIAHE